MALASVTEWAGPGLVVERDRTVDGLRTFSRSMGLGRRSGAAEDVVLVHGAGVSSEYWRPAQRLLAEAGPYRVHALDLPGFGRSQDPPWAPDLYRYARHVLRWCEAALPGPFHLVGQSFGCDVAVACALEAPERVRRLVLAGPAGLPCVPSLPRQILSAGVDAFREELCLYPVILPDYLRCGLLRILATLRQQPRCPQDLPLERVEVPTLVLRGERDAVVTKAACRKLAARLPRAELATIPGAHGSHCTHAEAFVQATAAFLAAERHSRRAAG